MFIDDNQKNATLPIALASAGVIGTAPLTVDIASSFNVTYTGAVNGTITLPTPTQTIAGDLVKVCNTGTVPFTFGNLIITAGNHGYAHWTGTFWSFEQDANNDKVLYTGNVTVPTVAPAKGIDTVVLSDGKRFEWNGTAWVNLGVPVTLAAFDNDLGIGVDGKVETGFPLHRDTFTTGAFYREWSNNRTGVTGAGAGLVYGLNNYGLGSGYWDKALIGQGSATIGYYNNVLGAYSLASGQQNVVTSSHGFATGYLNRVTSTYSQASGYNGTNAGYISSISGGNSNQIQAGNYHYIGGGYDNIISAGNYNAISEGSSNRAAGQYNIIGNGSSNNISGTHNVIAGGISQTMAGSYNGIGAGYVNRVAGTYNYAVGYNNNLSAASYGNSVSGYSHVVTGERGVIGGNGNTYAGAYGAMFGNANTMAAGRYGSLVSGASNQMLGSWNSGVIGEGNIVEAGSLYTKIIGGYYNTAKANTHVVYALGQQNIIGNATGVLTNGGAGAIGIANTVLGYSSQAFGANNVMSGTGFGYNYLIGYNNTTTGAAEQNVLIGQSATTSRTGTVTIKASGQRVNITTLPNYNNAAAANADATLIAGDLYTITQGSGKQLMIK